MERIRMERIRARVNGKIFWLICTFCIFVFLVIVSAAGIQSFHEYVDYPTLFYMTLFTLAVLYLTGMAKDFGHGFRLVFLKNRAVSRMELQKSLNAVRFAKRISALEAVVIASVNLVDMLYHMDSPVNIGPALATSLLSAVYAGLFAALLTLVTGKLESMIVTYMEETDTEAAGQEEQPDSQTIYFKLRAKGLTDREAEVARLVSCEMTNREIGQMLFISDATVKKHITHILEKTKMDDREELTKMIREML